MWVTRARLFWNWLVGRSPTDREIDDELEAFVEMLGEEKVRAGASPEEARRVITDLMRAISEQAP